MPNIAYTIKKKRKIKRMTLTVKQGGEVVVTIPWFFPEYSAQLFVQKKADWIIATQAKLEKKFKNKIPLRQTKTEFKQKKDQALNFVTARLEHFNTFYKFSYKDVRIKNHSSRWGSCSSKANLNFNYKIVDLPQELADYIVVHELCHLKEMNHAKKFWDLVGQALPDYKERRALLKKKYVTLQ